MTEADMRRIIENRFMPKDTDTLRWLGLKGCTISNDIIETPGSHGVMNATLGYGVDLTLEFAVDEYFPPDPNGRFASDRAGRWFLSEKTTHHRLDRRELQKIFEDV